LAAEDEGNGAEPFAAVAELTSAAEPQPERGDLAFPRWVKPISSYTRAVTSEFSWSRYG
jgi:hypothetical protein